MTEWNAAAAFLSYSERAMGKSLDMISKCVARLSEEQMHARGGDHENSVVNLLLHLEGNIRQWILHGIAGQPDVRVREAEFALDTNVSGAEALERLRGTVSETRAVIAGLPEERLGEIVDPQPTGVARNLPVLDAIYRIVSHLDHHNGQIVLLAKQLTATDLDLVMPRKR